eukprot:scaffold47_cov258-Pinguiococcus_pyrenoidosus.AAC.57
MHCRYDMRSSEVRRVCLRQSRGQLPRDGRLLEGEGHIAQDHRYLVRAECGRLSRMVKYPVCNCSPRIAHAHVVQQLAERPRIAGLRLPDHHGVDNNGMRWRIPNDADGLELEVFLTYDCRIVILPNPDIDDLAGRSY